MLVGVNIKAKMKEESVRKEGKKDKSKTQRDMNTVLKKGGKKEKERP